MNKVLKKTFKSGSKTYFNSSIFFPKNVREDVFKLYGFVRVADDYVDAIPQEADAFYRFTDEYREAMNGRETDNVIISSFVELSRRLKFAPEWTDAFLHSMEMDIKKNVYRTIDETLEYIYGSAEVIGLFMAKVLRLPAESYPFAQMLGRAMQYINFIRDIDEDVSLNRTYIPTEDSGYSDLSKEVTLNAPDKFESFIRQHLDFYNGWQSEAEKGFDYIPKRFLIPIKTASDMYQWTGEQIRKNPSVVYERKVKPSKRKIIFTIIKNSFTIRKDGKRLIKC